MKQSLTDVEIDAQNDSCDFLYGEDDSIKTPAYLGLLIVARAVVFAAILVARAIRETKGV